MTLGNILRHIEAHMAERERFAKMRAFQKDVTCHHIHAEFKCEEIKPRVRYKLTTVVVRVCDGLLPDRVVWM